MACKRVRVNPLGLAAGRPRRDPGLLQGIGQLTCADYAIGPDRQRRDEPPSAQ
jgi:hypothetical protein